MPLAIVHPFIVHFAISLGLLFGLMVLFPKFEERFPLRVSGVLRRMTILCLVLAILTGSLALWRISRHPSDIPPQALIHGIVALSGTVLFLMIGPSKRFASPLLARSLAAGALLLILSAAALGGALVYEDRLGTSFPSLSR